MKRYSIAIIIGLYIFSSIFFPFSNKVIADTTYKAYGEQGISMRSVALSNSTDFGQVIENEAGDYLAVWSDARSGTSNNDIYVQKFNSAGTPQWTTNGVALVTSSNNQLFPTVTSDGAGGAIVTWTDARTDAGDIYAQKVNSSGTVQWTTNGVVISNAANTQTTPIIATDGSGGAIIAWSDTVVDANGDIYAQRINTSGTVQWTANGIVISNGSQFQRFATIIAKNYAITTDRSGGAVIVWEDSRGTLFDLYAQRVDGSGAALWTANGLAISTGAGNQTNGMVRNDAITGFIFSWDDGRSGNVDIYAQKLNPAGTAQWTANGLGVSVTAGTQVNPFLYEDGVGNSYLTWLDNRSGTFLTYMQKLNSSGSGQWTANGIPANSDPSTQTVPLITDDGNGGTYVQWTVSSRGTYMQHSDSSGSFLWKPTGNIVYNSTTSNSRGIFRDHNNDVISFSDVFTTKFEAKIQKIQNDNADLVSNFSDQLSRINEGVDSSHTIKYVSSDTVNSGERISITIPAGFTFGGSYDFNDMQLSVGSTGNCDTATFTNKTIAAAASGTTWGAIYSSQVATFLSDTDNIGSGLCVRITLSTNGAGHTITNPTVGANTVYRPTILSGRQNGTAAIIILDDAGTPDSDQIQINGSIYTTISLDLDTVVTDCNNSTETSLNSVNLGLLTPGTVKKSDSTIKFICIDAATNAGLGINIFARSNRSNAVGALVSGANSIPSATADLTNPINTSGYGIRVSSVGTPDFGSLTINSPFNSATPGSVGQLPGILSAEAQIVDSTGPVQTATASRIGVEVAAKANLSTVPGAYSDIISFTALVNF